MGQKSPHSSLSSSEADSSYLQQDANGCWMQSAGVLPPNCNPPGKSPPLFVTCQRATFSTHLRGSALVHKHAEVSSDHGGPLPEPAEVSSTFAQGTNPSLHPELHHNGARGSSSSSNVNSSGVAEKPLGSELVASSYGPTSASSPHIAAGERATSAPPAAGDENPSAARAAPQCPLKEASIIRTTAAEESKFHCGKQGPGIPSGTCQAQQVPRAAFADSRLLNFGPRLSCSPAMSAPVEQVGTLRLGSGELAGSGRALRQGSGLAQPLAAAGTPGGQCPVSPSREHCSPSKAPARRGHLSPSHPNRFQLRFGVVLAVRFSVPF